MAIIMWPKLRHAGVGEAISLYLLLSLNVYKIYHAKFEGVLVNVVLFVLKTKLLKVAFTMTRLSAIFHFRFVLYGARDKDNITKSKVLI